MDDLESQCALIIGRVSCIESIEEGKFLCTVDLPLDGLVCTLSTEKEGSSTADDTTSQGALEELLNVHHNLDSPVTASSQLVIISWQQEKPQIINRIVISGMLAPDLLAWEAPSNTCVVGSNSSSILQAYTIIRDTMSPSKEIMLQDSKRPKGVAIHNQEVWLMVGESTPALYPQMAIPTTEYSEYSVILQMTPGLPQTHPPGLDEELAAATLNYRNSSYGSLPLRHCSSYLPPAVSSEATDSYFGPTRAPHRTSSGKAISEQAGVTLPPPTAHSLTNLVHIANAASCAEDHHHMRNFPPPAADHTMVPSDYLTQGGTVLRRPSSRTPDPDDCHHQASATKPPPPSSSGMPPKKFNSTSLKVSRRKQAPVSNLSNSLDSKRFPAVDGVNAVDFVNRRSGGGGAVVATTADMTIGPLEVAQSLDGDDEVAFRLTRIEECLVNLSSRQSQELREIKSEMATTKQLLTSVFLQLLPGEVRKEVITAVSEEFKEEVLELKDTINKNMAKTEDISAEIQIDLVRCKTEIDMLKDQLRELEGRKEYQY